MEYKTWAQSKADILEVLSSGSSGNIGEISIKSGLQLQTTISHYPSPVFSVAHYEDSCNHLEYYVVNYVSSGGESAIAEWRYNPEEQSLKIQRKFTIRNCLKHLIWIASQRAYVGYCDDMTLRGYKGTNMEEKVRISVPNSVLCITYLQDWDELITAGQGHVISWCLGKIDFGRPFQWKESQIDCDVNGKIISYPAANFCLSSTVMNIDDFAIWVRRLTYVKSTKTLMALSDEAVYIINMKTRKQVDTILNTHDASLTCCAYYPRFSYFISAARDGSLHVYHTVANALVHKFSGHRDGLTGVACMSTHPILVSWSHTSGCVRMWRLDTLELCSESALAERITNLWMESQERIFYQTESEIRLFDINVLYTICSTLSAPAQSLKMCTVTTTMKASQQDLKIDPKSSTLLGNNNVVVVKHSEAHKPFSKEENDKTTLTPRLRLMCVLDDRCIMTVSPETGSVTQIIFPMTDRDKDIVSIDLNKNGKSCFVLLQTGDVVEFDCTVNPGRIKNPMVNQSKSQKVTCIAAFEAEVESFNAIGEPTIASVCSLLIGYENGYLQIYKEGLELSTGAFVNLNVEPVKIHSGYVSHLFVPTEKQLRFLSRINNDLIKESRRSVCGNGKVLITIGSDLVVSIWLFKLHRDESLIPAMTLRKLNSLHLGVTPTFITAVDDVMLISLVDRTIEMYWMDFKITGLDPDSAGEITLGRLENIPVDYELRHHAPITSVSESDILKLFATSGKNEVIKIWDLDGLLIKELDVGDMLTSVCFSNGRDLLASLRNHIVRIESHRYLPLDYLEALLDYDEKYCVEDVAPESPLPMEANSTVVACAMPAMNLISKSIARPKEKFGDVKEESKRKKKLDGASAHRRRSTKIAAAGDFRRRTFFDLDEKNVSDDEEKKTETQKPSIAPSSFPHRVIRDIILPDQVLENMKLWPVAPDGYIPNSVIRQKIKSFYPSIPDKYFVDLYEIGKVNNLGYAEAKKILCGLQEDSLKQVQEDKRKVKKKISNSVLPPYRFLDDILKSVSSERWCSLSLDIRNLDQGLKYLAEFLRTCSSLVALRICAAVMKIHDECAKISQLDQQIEGLSIQNSGISHTSQKVIASNVLPLLKSKCSEVREMVGCLLSKFDETIVRDCIVSFLRPIANELEKAIQDKTDAVDDLLDLITTAVSTVSSRVDPDLLRPLTPNSDFSTNLEINVSLGSLQNRMVQALTSVGLADDIAKMWTSFIAAGDRLVCDSSPQTNAIQNEKLGCLTTESSRNAIIPSAKAVQPNVSAFHGDRKDNTLRLPVVRITEVFKSPSVEDQCNLPMNISNSSRSSKSPTSTPDTSAFMKGSSMSKESLLALDFRPWLPRSISREYVVPQNSRQLEYCHRYRIRSYQNEALCVVRAFSRQQRREDGFKKHEYKETRLTTTSADKQQTIPENLAHHAEHLTTRYCPNNDITAPEGFTKSAVVDVDSDEWRIILDKLRRTRGKLMPELVAQLKNGKSNPAIGSNHFSAGRLYLKGTLNLNSIAE